MFLLLLVLAVMFLITWKDGMLYRRIRRLFARDATADPEVRARARRRSTGGADAASARVVDPAALAWTALDDLQLDRLLRESD